MNTASLLSTAAAAVESGSDPSRVLDDLVDALVDADPTAAGFAADLAYLWTLRERTAPEVARVLARFAQTA